MASSTATMVAGTGSKAAPMWRIRQAVVTYTGLIPYVAFALFPLYIMLVTSFQTKQELNDLASSPFWVSGVTGENYKYLAERTHFFDRWLVNTIIVSVTLVD